MGHIFVSYSRTDQDYTRRLAEDIRHRGFDVWMDDRIDFGDRWWRTIVKAIRESSAVVVVMTPEAEQSEWVEREILLAQRERKPIMPVLLKDQEFALLITSQYSDVRHGGMPGVDFYERMGRIMQGQKPVGMSQEMRAVQPSPPSPVHVAPQPAVQPRLRQGSAPPAARKLDSRPVKAGLSRGVLVGIGVGVVIAIIAVLALYNIIGGDDDGNGASDSPTDNAEQFLLAVGEGDLDRANQYTCASSQNILPQFLYNGVWEAYAIQFGINGSITDISCSGSGSQVTCTYWLVWQSGSSPSQDSFLIEDNKVCDIVIQ